ncbi:MAG: hypothetical protein SPJ71_08975 [Candidatus Limisoma sp.]|nr:hypothetical protein [Bacteroidales bacterium]MDY5894682.1 hypothetical protein [Candidatus Limisoma sp.]
MIETQPYQVPASTYMRQLFADWLADRWWTVVAVVLPFVALSFVDVRFVYVALMAGFIVVPMLLGFVYFYYAFRPVAVSAVRRQLARIDDAGITVVFLNDDLCVGETRYEWAAFDDCTVADGYIRLDFVDGTYNFLLVPEDSFATEDDFDKTSKNICNRVLGNNA